MAVILDWTLANCQRADGLTRGRAKNRPGGRPGRGRGGPRRGSSRPRPASLGRSRRLRRVPTSPEKTNPTSREAGRPASATSAGGSGWISGAMSSKDSSTSGPSIQLSRALSSRNARNSPRSVRRLVLAGEGRLLRRVEQRPVDRLGPVLLDRLQVERLADLLEPGDLVVDDRQQLAAGPAGFFLVAQTLAITRLEVAEEAPAGVAEHPVNG